MFKTFEEIINAAKISEKKQRVAIVGSEKLVAIEAGIDILNENIGIPIFLGNEKKIKEILLKIPFEKELEIINTVSDEESATKAVDLVLEGKIDLILKGTVSTATLLKAVLRKENGLKESSVLSDVFIYEDPMAEKNNKRLIGLSDGGLIPLPDLETKIEITKSAVKVFKKLGFEKPKVAYISAVEKVTDKIKSTTDAAEIKRRYETGEFKIDAFIDGPFAIDNVISEESAKIKGINSVMAGEADILIVPNIETGNVLGKLANYYGHAQNGHVILGAKVPVLITSRADDAKTKLNSVALGIITSM